METSIYKNLINKYETHVDNSKLWKKFEIEVLKINSIEEIKDLITYTREKLGVEVDDEFIVSKGHAEYDAKTKSVKIVVDFTNPTYITRFTIAHELAHILFDLKSLKKNFIIESNYVRNELHHDEKEIRANRFAADFLMPEELINESINKIYDDLKDAGDDKNFSINHVLPILSKEYMVSEYAVLNRLRNLGRIK